MPHQIGFKQTLNGNVNIDGPYAFDALTQAKLGEMRDAGFTPFCWDCGGEDGPEYYYREVNDQIFLACHPGTKHLHRRFCSSFAEFVAPRSNLDPRESASGIQEDDSGFVVKLSTKFVRRVNSKPRNTNPKGPVGRSRIHRPGRRGYSSTPVGLFEFALERGGLTRHDPESPRSPGWTAQAKTLEEVLSRGVGDDGRPLLERIVLPHGENQREVCSALDRIRQADGDAKAQRRVVVAPLTSFESYGEDEVRLSLGFVDKPVHLPGMSWHRVIRGGQRKGFAAALERIKQGDASSHVLVIGLVEHRADGTLWIEGAKLLVFSAHWILVDSGHELKAVNDCVAKGLKFWKPLAPVDGLGYIPDLIIFLADGRWLIWEIGGSKARKYLHQLWVKSVRYEQSHPGLWGIWRADSEKMPDLSCIPLPRDTSVWRIPDEDTP